MKLARVLIEGRPRLAVIVGAEVRPLDAAVSALADDDLARAADVPNVLEALQRLASHEARVTGPAGSGARLLSPIARPGKIVAIGRNYAEHAAEQGADLPPEPVVFAKFPSSIVGPEDEITWSRSLTDSVDFEAELAVVIGRDARRVAREQALDYVLGYTCLNDVSARDLQFGDGQWVRGKSLDTFCPMGPWLVTRDDIPDPQTLSITCVVSGETLQSSSTAAMIFGVAELVHRLSWSFILRAGDVIATGTPEGVGYFREPRRLLHDGDVVEVVVGEIGTLRNPVKVVETPV